MRWVSLPAELATPHLLALPVGVHPIREPLERLLSDVAQADLARALDAAAHAFGAARERSDRYAGALALIARADVLRRLMRWEDGLDAIRLALRWLETDVAPVARYNEAIAVYVEAVIHYTLRADEKAAATFAYARNALEESERHWAFEHDTARVFDCRNVIRWMTQLATLPVADLDESVVQVMPVYELANGTLVRTDAIALPPFQSMIPSEVVARYCPPGIRPLGLETVVFPSLRPDIQYAAIRIGDPGFFSLPGSIEGTPPFGEVKMGDVLIVEVTGSVSGSGELVLTSDHPFVRGSDGRVTFGPAPQSRDAGADGTAPGVMGIPRVLIRDVEAQ